MPTFRSRQQCLALALLAVICLTGHPTQAEEAPRRAKWDVFYDANAGRPPRSVLIQALDLFEAEGREVSRAVDAGCGAGIDTRFLLELGIAVHAFDAAPEGITRLREQVDERHRSKLRAEVATFHEASYEKGVDLVFAGFALPFARPEHFDLAWSRLVDSLAVGGRFAGHLFGDRDDWADVPGRSHHSREEAEALLREHFEIEVFKEVDEDGGTASGKTKRWHYFEIVARKARD